MFIDSATCSLYTVYLQYFTVINNELTFLVLVRCNFKTWVSCFPASQLPTAKSESSETARRAASKRNWAEKPRWESVWQELAKFPYGHIDSHRFTLIHIDSRLLDVTWPILALLFSIVRSVLFKRLLRLWPIVFIFRACSSDEICFAVSCLEHMSHPDLSISRELKRKLATLLIHAGWHVGSGWMCNPALGCTYPSWDGDNQAPTTSKPRRGRSPTPRFPSVSNSNGK